MRKFLVLFFVIIALNSYSQYDDLYWDNGYNGTTYLTYNHFPNYSARIQLFWGGLFYISYWSYYDRYWYRPYYYGNYYNNHYYAYNHHHHRKFKNSNTYYGHRSRMSSNTTSNPTRPTYSSPKRPTPPRTHSRPAPVRRSNVVRSRPR